VRAAMEYQAPFVLFLVLLSPSCRIDVVVAESSQISQGRPTDRSFLPSRVPQQWPGVYHVLLDETRKLFEAAEWRIVCTVCMPSMGEREREREVEPPIFLLSENAPDLEGVYFIICKEGILDVRPNSSPRGHHRVQRCFEVKAVSVKP
jgi:hypothetical protein